MIRRLRWKIVAINMAMVTAVLLAVFVGVLVSSRAAVERTVNQRLMQVVQTGRYDASLTGEGSGRPCFVADVYPSGTVRLSGSSYYRLDDQDAMAEIVTACLEQGDSSGILRSYHLRYLRADGPLYTRIAFTDAAQEDATLRAVVKMCLLVGAAALAVLLGCSYLLAGLAARPVARSLDQQRRFLSDASHELKTPLTVILSSADLMQQTGGPAGPAAVCGQHPLVRPADEAAGGGYADPVPGRRRAAEGRHGPGGPVRCRGGHGAAVRAGGLRGRAAAEL